MEQQHSQKTPALRRQALFTLGLAFISQSVLATPGQSQLSTVQGWLQVLGGTIITIAVMYVSLKMAFQKTPFHELSHVLAGGVLFGCASLVGSMLISG
ncbi:TrbC/VirB2 family protein [Propionivibrio sp.]|uniref:TrbC/VirB2 family protein n=1 Tax=Propionivibrio sp. TaxID=2212460 RepID=UPI0039E460CB